MGYSNYWERFPCDSARAELAFHHLVRDCWRLFTYCDHKGLKLCGADGYGVPEVMGDAIVFNGAAPLDYETFCFRRFVSFVPGDAGRFVARDFCKTGSRPYDAAVVAVLLLAADRYGSALSIGSDGAGGSDAAPVPAAELVRGLQLLTAAFPDRRGRYSLAPFYGGAPVAVAV
jgi:hypothetical protein